MQLEGEPLSPSALIAFASEQLAANGYRVVRELRDTELPGDRAFIAEDEFSVIALVAFDTWQQLADEWENAQADLAGLLARRLARSAPKAWDAYLVLLCSSSPIDRAAVTQIERDTTRVRKIVATGDMLRTTSDVARIIDIFLPLDLPSEHAIFEDVLDTLPDLLRGSIDPQAVRIVVEAFKSMEAPLERLHAMGSDQ